MSGRIGLLPIAILIGGLTLSLKVGSLSIEGANLIFSAAVAEQETKADAKTAGAKSADKKADGDKVAGEETEAHADEDEAAEADDDKVFDAATASDVELELLQQLAARRDRLQEQEAALKLREATLAAAERRVKTKLEQLSKIRAEIEALLKRQDAADLAKIKRLVKIYENMKPKDAARIFGLMDMEVLLDVVERMREVKAAPILAKMKPSKAKEVTTALAARRELPQFRRNAAEGPAGRQ